MRTEMKGSCIWSDDRLGWLYGTEVSCLYVEVKIYQN